MVEEEVVESKLEEINKTKDDNLSKVNQYVVELTLGKGSFGTVYRAGAPDHPFACASPRRTRRK